MSEPLTEERLAEIEEEAAGISAVDDLLAEVKRLRLVVARERLPRLLLVERLLAIFAPGEDGYVELSRRLADPETLDWTAFEQAIRARGQQ